MKFFLPFARDELQAEDTYTAIKKFIAPDGTISETRYYAIYFDTTGRN